MTLYKSRYGLAPRSLLPSLEDKQPFVVAYILSKNPWHVCLAAVVIHPSYISLQSSHSLKLKADLFSSSITKDRLPKSETHAMFFLVLVPRIFPVLHIQLLVHVLDKEVGIL